MSIYPSRVTSFSKRRRLSALFLAFGLAASACGTPADGDTAVETSAISVNGGNTDTSAPETDDQAANADQSEDEAPADEPTDSDDADAAAPVQAGETKRARLGDQVLAANQTISTGRFEGRITVSSEDIPDGVELVMSGEYNSANESSEISLDLGALATAAAEAEGADMGPFAAMFEEPMIVRTIGSRSFVSWSLLSLLSGGQGTWIEAEADDADQITSTFGAGPTGSPAEFLSALEEANADVTELGTDDVRGVSTTHIRAIVDLAELDAAVSDEERDTLERDLGQLDTAGFPIDFWIDDDGLIRRYSMDINGTGTDVEDESEGSIVFEFFDYGEAITIEVPPANEIISSDQLDLEGFGF